MSSDKTRIYFTIDTETSMGGAWRNPAAGPIPIEQSIFGKIDSKYFGIPFIMDVLEEHGFRGTFFTEMFCAYAVGSSEVEKVCSYIRRRGHDLQLHLHPVYWYFRKFLDGGEKQEKDLMWKLPASEQETLIGEGVELFRKFAGIPPRAYRAGCYGASETTLGILHRHGIEIDSSYNLCYLGVTCGFDLKLLNTPCQLEGIQEFPVTNFSVAWNSGYKPLEVGAVSVTEVMATIAALREAGCRDVVVSLHSFSFLKNLEGGAGRCQPDRIVMRRFRKLCKAIAMHSNEMEAAVLGEANLSSAQLQGSGFVPSLGWTRPLARKLVQGLNRIAWI